MIIGIGGLATAGKSTVATHLVKNHDFMEINFADALREMALAIDPIIGVDMYEDELRLQEVVERDGWAHAKFFHPEIRQFMQRLGTDGVRNVLGQDTWVNEWQKRVGKCLSNRIVVSDVRFKNEISGIELNGFNEPYRLWYIERPGVVRLDHASEQLTAEDFYEVLINDGTPGELASRVDYMIDGPA